MIKGQSTTNICKCWTLLLSRLGKVKHWFITAKSISKMAVKMSVSQQDPELFKSVINMENRS